MKDMAITLAKATDVAAIANIEQESFGIDAFSDRQISYLISRAKGVFYVAVTDGKIAGYICVLSHSRRKSLRIYSIAVGSAMRGMGIAQMLLDKACELLREKGSTAVRLEVNVNNVAAIRLYEKNGFSVIGKRPSYYKNGSDAYVMEKKNRRTQV